MNYQKKYKILLSAYACEPNRGSEPGIGWNWALEIAQRGHSVWVLTRANNKDVIKSFYKKNKCPDNLHFIYHDLPKWILFFKRGTIGVNIYYLLWQISSYFSIYKNKYKFDFVHHITFGVFRHFSLLHRLRIPFFFGPVGGGEQMPNLIKKNLSYSFQIVETIRELINWLSKFNPLLRFMYSKSALIFCKTNETKIFIPSIFHDKCITNLEIGILKNCINDKTKFKINCEDQFKILYVGRFLYWKGIDIAIDTIDELVNKYNINCKMYMVGKGNYLNNIIKKIDSLNLNKNIEIIDWIPQSELKSFYEKASFFLFPSLHDSSGNVVLESLSNGLPVACLDLGGPAQVVSNKSSIIISTINKTHKQIVKDLSYSISNILSDEENLMLMKYEAIKRSKEFIWDKTVDNTYSKIESFMKKSKN